MKVFETEVKHNVGKVLLMSKSSLSDGVRRIEEGEDGLSEL